MKVAGLICEFNPFHKGHKFLIDNLRTELKPDAVVCVMSGDFTQRGYPALWDKYERAQLALSQGVDLVVELPVRYAVNAAPEFAKGGITVLRKMGCVTDLVFGSECGDIEALKAAMNVEKKAGFKERLQENLDNGDSYPLAYSKASQNPIFQGANNTLGIEYLREIRRQKASFKPYTVKRFFGISATAIRKDIAEGRTVRLNYKKPEWDLQCDERLFDLVRYLLLNKTAEELADVLEVSEGIENRLKKAAIEAHDYDELVQLAKSKRFTYAKISRILMQMVLGITKKNAKFNVDTVKVLAFNDRGKRVLKEAKNIGKINFGADKFDANAHDVYTILTAKNVYSNSDYVINAKPFENNF